MKFFQRFRGGWPIRDFIKQYLRNCNDKHKRDLHTEVQAEKINSGGWANKPRSKKKSKGVEVELGADKVNGDVGEDEDEDESDEWMEVDEDDEDEDGGVDANKGSGSGKGDDLDNNLKEIPPDDEIPVDGLFDDDGESHGNLNLAEWIDDNAVEVDPLLRSSFDKVCIYPCPDTTLIIRIYTGEQTSRRISG